MFAIAQNQSCIQMLYWYIQPESSSDYSTMQHVTAIILSVKRFVDASYSSPVARKLP